MKLRPLVLALAFAVSSAVHAQALLEGTPPPPVTETQQLAKIESVPQLLAMGEKYDKAADWRRYAYVMERLMQLRPDAGNIRYELAAAYAMQDDKTKAYDALLRLRNAGWAFHPEADERFKGVQGTKVWDYLLEGFKQNAQPIGKGAIAFELPKADLLVEAIAYDPGAKTVLAASTREGKILRVGADGKTSDFIVPDEKNGLMSVLDLAVDAKHNALWVAAAGGPLLKKGKSEDYGKSGVWKFELSSGKFVDRFMVEGAGKHELSAIAVAPSGDVYAADGAARAVYKLRGDKLELALANPKLSAIRGITVSDDGSKLFLADYETGIYGIDLTKGAAWQVAPAKNFTAFGIDGLSYRKGELIAVQNGTAPRRVMRLKLNDDAHAILSADALASGKPEFELPTRGTVADGKFYLIANNQRGQYDRYGIPRDEKKLEATKIFAVDL